MTPIPGIDKCRHCLQRGHWRDECDLLIPPPGRKEHRERIALIVRRFTEGEYGPQHKMMMIKTEMEMWTEVEKETRK